MRHLKSGGLFCVGLALAFTRISPAQEPSAAPQQEPSAQAPAAPQTPPAAPGRQKPAEVRVVTEPDRIDGAFSVDLFYWYSPNKPIMRTGKGAAAGANATLDFPNDRYNTPGVQLSFPAGGQNNIRLSFFRSQGRGNALAPADVSYFGTDYAKGDYLSTAYTVQHGKISLDYLSWPFPVHNANFRIKTLWEVQYTSMKTTIDAPLKAAADSTAQTVATGSKWLIWPAIGMGIEQRFSRNVRFELRGSGFALPHLPTLWDTEGFLAVRAGQIEFQFGGKAFHFKTSPRQDLYFRDTLAGATIGVRWYPK